MEDMMAAEKVQSSSGGTVLRVLDVLDHPHGGRIARLKLEGGKMPSARSWGGRKLRATGPRGEKGSLEVLGFALTGGKVSDRRLRSTGRVDLHVREAAGSPPLDLTWRVAPE